MSEEGPPSSGAPPAGSDATPASGEDRRALRQSTRGRISMVWLIPVVAVLLGASLVIRSYMDRGPTVEIEFPQAAGIQAGATPVKLLDVEVGVVQEVRFMPDLEGVVVRAELEPSAADFLREDSVFWLVRPRVSLAGVSGIETLLSGQYIELVPGESGARRDRFVGRESPPIGARYPNAKSVVLETDRLGAITQGTPLYHRGIAAGEVEQVELGDDERIRVYVVIDEAFAPHVREDTLFWNASGISAELGLDGLEVRTEGLIALLGAGIAFASPEDGAEAKSGTVFPLHESADAAQTARQRAESLAVWLESRRAIGLGPGTPLFYRGIEIGSLGSSHLTPDAQAVRIRAFVAPRYRPLVREGTRFFKSSGIDLALGLDGVRLRTEGLKAVAFGGVSIAVPGATGAPADDGDLFALYDEPEEAWLAWQPAIGLGSGGPADAGPQEHRLPPIPNAGALELRLLAVDASGLGEGSPVRYRSLPVGEVTGLSLAEQGDAFEVRIRIDAEHRGLVGEGSRFWRTAGFALDVGLDGVDVEVGSLRTLALGGVSFANPLGRGARAGRGTRFDLHPNRETALADAADAEVLIVYLEAHESSLQSGAPVYFRRHPIGEVGDTELTADAQAVRVALRIDRSYAPLVRGNTHFWSPDAVHVQASLAGVDVAAAPIQALLAGGVMLATPDESQAVVENGAVFRLDEDAPPGWEHWHPSLSLDGGVPAHFMTDSEKPAGLQVVLVAQDVDSIGEGDPIFYRGLQIGSLGAATLAADGRAVEVEALVRSEFATVVRENTRFWNASGLGVDIGWGGVEARTGPLETVIRGGIQVATPEPAGAPAQSGDRFPLAAEPEEGWQEWSPVLR